MPEGWCTTTVDDICERVSVGIVIRPTQYYTRSPDGVRAFRSANVREGKVGNSDWVYLTPEGHAKNAKSSLAAGDVLVVRSGAPGTSCVVPEKYAGSNCIDIVFARPDTESVLPEYLCAFTNSSVGRRQVVRKQGGLALKHFNVSAYKQMNVLLPPLPEQRRIVEILRTWDEAIEKTERLIEGKNRSMKALKKALVFGTTRVPQFGSVTSYVKRKWLSHPSDWRFPCIGEIATPTNERNSAREDLAVLSCSKHVGFVKSLEYFGRKVFSDDTSNYIVVPRGAFGYPSNHIEEGSIGLQDVVDVGIVSPIYTVFNADPRLVDRNFLFILLKTETYRHIFSASTSASVDRRGSLRWKEFSRIRIPLPNIEEQRAISKVVANAESEIELIEKELGLVKSQKRGLMQKLLTGEWRVPLDGGAA